ncbi:uncharacterized protein FFMR_07255 [Fusarium fujikuroi]|nr:uncharacterized protein FFMR_07255 [Fusarium fujikuroi]
MRLINVKTSVIEEFFDVAIPPYAILSHTWGDDEVDFNDWQDKPRAKTKGGYTKILTAQRQAQSDNLEFLWVDTCCIDKRSSAELSEAINSMFVWYRDSDICYAYHADVEHIQPQQQSKSSDAPTYDDFDIPECFSGDASSLRVRSLVRTSTNNTQVGGLSSSKWFTRGWTLQELLAPRKLEFFSGSWAFLDTKETLAVQLSEITQINVAYLTGEDVRTASVAKRMSWASRRKTKRQEDIVYCLMGTFDVNMPLIYGEGNRAFIRLQEEILKRSNDESIFAWSNQDSNRPFGIHQTNSELGKHCGLVAKSPRYLSGSAAIIAVPEEGHQIEATNATVLLKSLDERYLSHPNDIRRRYVRLQARDI